MNGRSGTWSNTAHNGNSSLEINSRTSALVESDQPVLTRSVHLIKKIDGHWLIVHELGSPACQVLRIAQTPWARTVRNCTRR